MKTAKQPRIKINPLLRRRIIFDLMPCTLRGSFVSQNERLLVSLRTNRLIDRFLDISTFPLHSKVGLCEMHFDEKMPDEIYIGTSDRGEKFIIPVIVFNNKTYVDIHKVLYSLEYCREKYHNYIIRPIAAQFSQLDDIEVLAMIELRDFSGHTYVEKQMHYHLVPVRDSQQRVLKMAMNEPLIRIKWQ